MNDFVSCARRRLRRVLDLQSSSTRSRSSASTTRRRPGSRSRRTTSSSPRTRSRSSRTTRVACVRIEAQYERGLITEEERKDSIVNVWTEATDTVAEAMGRLALQDEPDLHDGQLGSAWIVQADPPAGRHARPHGEPEGRHHRAPDQGQLHGRPVGARVLHLHARRPQGSRRHGSSHRRLGLPDAASRRRLAGRHRPRGGLRHRRLHLAAAGRSRRSQPLPRRPDQREEIHKPLASGKPGKTVLLEKGVEITIPRLRELHDELGEVAAEFAVPVRTVLKCRSEFGVCQACYGTFLATGEHVRDRRRGRHHRRAVDRRAGHPADDADVPHRAASPAPTSRTASRASSRSSRPATRRVRPASLRSAAGWRSRTPTAGPRSPSIPTGSTRTASRTRRRSTSSLAGRGSSSTSGQVVEPGDALHEGSLAPAELLALALEGRQGIDADRALSRRRGPERLQVAGRRHPRQAHRADRAADAEEGARRQRRRHRPAARPARRQARARARERAHQEGEEGAGDVRAAHPRHHEGLARDRVVPLGRLLPGDDEGADRRVDRGQGRPAARPEGERHHRQADPGRDRPQELPARRDRPERGRSRRGLHAGRRPRSSCSPRWRRSAPTATAPTSASSGSASPRTGTGTATARGAIRSRPRRSPRSTRRSTRRARPDPTEIEGRPRAPFVFSDWKFPLFAGSAPGLPQRGDPA